jgi:L-seryl-tRNA(Ser) seleniumtransferase
MLRKSAALDGCLMGIYDELGVRTFINAGGWMFTRYGGSIMREEVMAAMAAAAKGFVNLYELQERVGRAIAGMTGNEAAYVSCGAASGILLAVATCIAGREEALAERLPASEGMKNEVVMWRSERGTEADAAVRASGGRIVEVGRMEGTTEAELARALGERTAAVLLLANERRAGVSVERVVTLARERRVKVIVDGAGAVPPRENLWRYTREWGCDAFVTSGGKGIRGPQSTGLVLGTRDMMEGCVFHGSPNLRIGRAMKVGKEELAGIYMAVKLFVAENPADRAAASARKVEHLVGSLQGIPDIRLSVARDGTEVVVELVAARLGTGEALERAMMAGEPAVLVKVRDNRMVLRGELLQPGEEQVVAERLRRVLMEGA